LDLDVGVLECHPFAPSHKESQTRDARDRCTRAATAPVHRPV
jgi:hypothetical protein